MTDPGDTIDFTITVQNTGNTTLSNVLVQDTLAVVSCPSPATPSGSIFTNAGDASSILAVGDTVVCVATYTIQQADINAGQVINTATVDSTDPSGTPVTGVVEETSPFTQRTSVALIKTATALPTVPAPVPGDIITYTFELENTGNVTLNSPQISDPQCIPDIPNGILTAANGLVTTTDVGSDGLLDAGERWTFMCGYAITQADIISSEITNTATGTGTPPPSSGLDDPTSTSSALVKAEQNTAITLDKIAGIPTTANGTLPAASDVGDTISYTFDIANTGNLPFETVTLSDPLITAPPNNGTIICELNGAPPTPFILGSTPLPINQSVSCTADYTLTQDDIDAGMVSNMAAVTGDPPGPIPPPPEALSGAMVPIVPEPSLSIDKSASAIPSTVLAGSIITYTYLVENTGNVTIFNIAPVDQGPTFNGIPGTNALSAYSPALADLAPGQSQSYTATYVLSQQDLDNMAAASDPRTAIDNTASADGEPANGPIPTVLPSSVETGVEPDPSLELIKTSAITAPVAAGSVITYSFMLTNDGNVTISNPSMDDAMCQVPTGPLSFGVGFVSGDAGVIPQALDVGETWLFQCDYTITQADIDAGTVQNTATAAGQDPSGATTEDDSDSGNAGDDTGADNDPTNTPLPQTPSWEIAKSTVSTPTAVGDTLIYDFVVTNTGNTSINTVTVADAKCVGGIAALDVSSDIGSDGVLSPAGFGNSPSAEQWTYSCVSIPVTQAEIDSGNVVNTVIASGTAPGGLDDATDEVITPTPQTPSMSLVKSAGSATLNSDGSFDQVFNFELKNTGNVTLDNVSISDDIPSQFGACFVAVIAPGNASIIDLGEAGGSAAVAIGTAPTIVSTSALGVQDSLFVSNYVVRFDPNAAGCSFPSPAENTASGGSDQVADVSDNGTDPDAANPNDGGTPTPFSPPIPTPQLGLAKSAAVIMVNQGFSFDAEYSLLLQNTGDVDLQEIALFDDLASQLGAVFTASPASVPGSGVIVAPVVSIVTDAPPQNIVLPAANQAFTGGSESLFSDDSGFLGIGDVIEVRFTVRIDPTVVIPLPEEFQNSAETTGVAPDGADVSDQSNNGSDPTQGAGGAGEPTIITLDDVSALPITLGFFDAQRLGNGQVRIRWQTHTEVSNLGFNVYGRIDDEWQQLNDRVIPGQGDSVELIDYEFTTSVATEIFALSDIDGTGKETLHGPFMLGQSYGANDPRIETDWQPVKQRRLNKQDLRDARRKQQLMERNEMRRQKRAAAGGVR